MYARICATNDIRPAGSLRALVDSCWLSGVGSGKLIGTEYALAEHSAFARAQTGSLDHFGVEGDLDDWAILLPPPPSESDV